MNKKMDKLLKFMAIGCCTFAIALIIVLQQNNVKIQKHVKSANAIAESYTSTESNSWDISATENDSVTATLDENGLLTISGTGEMEDWTNSLWVPWSSVNKKIKSVKIEDGVTNIGNHVFSYCKNLISIEISSSVTSIGSYSFFYCNNLTSIEIPKGVKNIERGAFSSCESLTSIKVNEYNTVYKDDNGVLYSKDGTKLIAYPTGKSETEYRILSSVTSIEEEAFSRCSHLRKIEIPSTVTNISNYAFAYCDNLTSIEIPDSVTCIGDGAFLYCSNLSSIEIPSNVTSIGAKTFSHCFTLTSIKVNEENTAYKDDNGVLYSKDGTKIITYPPRKEETEYKIPNGVISIDSGAFSNCDNLKRVEIPNSIISIGDNAFMYCSNLTSIELPNSVTSIGNYAFLETTITNIVNTESNMIELPNILKRAQEETDILYTSKGFTLTNCSIEEAKIKIDDGKTYAEIEINDGKLKGLKYLIHYNSWDISANGDESVIATLDENGLLTVSGTGAMKDWSNMEETPWYAIREYIKSIEMENGITNIGNYAFENCDNLTSVEIPNSVTSIGAYSLFYCSNLTSIKIPKCVTSIGNHAFGSCDSLTSIEIPNGVTSIGDYAFDSCTSLTSIEIPSSVTSIGFSAFYGCTSLTSIEIPNGVTSIGDDAFGYCDNLTSIEIPNSVTSIGNGAFMCCYNLTSIEIPSSVTSIGFSAFWFCDGLTNVEIPSSVTTIGINPFVGCQNLININVDNNNKEYKDNNGVLYSKDGSIIIAYPAGKKDQEYEIPNSVVSIGFGAFWECYSLNKVYIPNSVTTIEHDAFLGCDNLTLLCHKDTPAMTYAKEDGIDYLILMNEIQPKTKVQQIKQQMGNNTEYKITNKNGEIITDTTYVTTGCKVESSDGENYIIIVTGDTNGDGQAEIKDILAINKHRLNKSKLQAEELLAGDVNGDGTVDIKDIMQINKFRLGKINQL